MYGIGLAVVAGAVGYGMLQNQVGANAQTNTAQWRVIGEIQDGMKDQAETNGRIDERTKLILDTLNSMK